MQVIFNRCLRKTRKFIIGSGILTAFLGITYYHFFGNISLEFTKPIGRAYEFQFKNDTPSDRVVKFFRIDLPLEQISIHKTTEDAYVEGNDQGFSLEVRIPAIEFRELDGQILPAKAPWTFRVPPLSNHAWMMPEAVLVDLHYELESSNYILAKIDAFFKIVGLYPHTKTIRYIIIDNYWTVSSSDSIGEAIRVLCRDDETMKASGTCKN